MLEISKSNFSVKYVIDAGAIIYDMMVRSPENGRIIIVDEDGTRDVFFDGEYVFETKGEVRLYGENIDYFKTRNSGDITSPYDLSIREVYMYKAVDIVNMKLTFVNLAELTKLYIDPDSLQKCTQMTRMCKGCRKLKETPYLPKTYALTDIQEIYRSAMYYQNTNDDDFYMLPVYKFNYMYTENVTNFVGAFDSTKLKSIPAISYKNAIDLNSAFAYMYWLKTVNLHLPKATSMKLLVNNCRELLNIKVVGENITNAYSPFYSCDNLSKITLMLDTPLLNAVAMFQYLNDFCVEGDFATDENCDTSSMFYRVSGTNLTQDEMDSLKAGGYRLIKSC